MTIIKTLTMCCFILSFFTKSSAQMAPTTSIYDITINDIDRQPIQLSDYKGKKILFVNVASECGFTGQYSDLQKLYDTYKDKLMIIGVPCNQFGGQESGTLETIKSFCQKNYGVTFLMTEKVDVKGDNQHPLYAWLTKKSLNGNQDTSVKWNFQKYLVDEKGHYVDYYLSATTPMNAKITNHLK